MIPEREREALMRLTMCARIECDICKYKDASLDECDERITKNMNILADALRTDHKTENNSEKPNNCEDDEYWKHLFIEVVKGHMSDAEANQAWYEYINRKDEPQLTQNYCGTCKYREVPCGDLPCDVCHGYSNYEPKTENSSEKTNNSTISKMEQVETKGLCKICMNYPCGYWDEEFITHNHSVRECRAFEPKDEPTGYNLSPVDKDINVRSKDEPQTERSE